MVRVLAASVVMLLSSVVAQAEEFPVPTLIIETAAGANIVTNGSFETGTFSGWTQTGNSSSGAPGYTTIASGGAAAGNSYASFGPVGSSGSITQTLTTVAGARYDLSYQLRTLNNGNPNQFTVYWNGGAVASLSLSNATLNNWTSFSALNLLATGSTTTLRFEFRHDPGWYHLDDVQVGASVPEPATMAMVGGALLLIGGYRRKRNQASCQRPSASDLRT